MNKYLTVLLYTFIISLFFLSVPSLPHVFAQETATSCFTTKVGNPAGNTQLPAGCEGSGGGATKVIELAKKQLGKTYVFGGPSPRNWSSWKPPNNEPNVFDCSSLVGWSWYWATGGKVNMPLATKATWGKVPASKFKVFTPAQKSQIQPGDIIYWEVGEIHHTALFEGPGGCPSKKCIIEAQQTGVPVKESDFEGRINSSSGPWVGFLRPINY